MQKPQQTSSGQSGSFDKGLTEDVDGMHKAPNQWTHARNAVNNSEKGDVLELSNEQSNYLCTSVPDTYTIIGNIHIGSDEWAIFSTNDTDSEIGIFKEDTCSYETIVNAACLNFNRENLIKGVGRTAYDCGKQVYWDDGENPSRVLNLDNVPWKQNCEIIDSCNICTDTDELDCDKIRIAPLLKDLSFSLEKGQVSGQMINGSYYVVGAYLINGVKVTDYSLPSNIQGLFTHNNISSSLDVFIDEADQEFDEFELVLVQFANFNVVAKKMGVYSTRQKKITFDQIPETNESIDPSLILIQNTIPDKSDAIFRNGPYLIRTGPTDKFDFNYQPLANQIETNWVSIEYPADYYRNGGNNTGYLRDEVYSLFIRWVFNTGDKTFSYHIPGRAAVQSDLSAVGGDDVLDSDFIDDFGNTTAPKYWNVYNTATITPNYPVTTTRDGGTVIAGGKMGYWESSEIYDDDKPQIWNAGTGNLDYDLCGKPIRHHRFPDNGLDTSPEMVTNHYNPVDGDKIRVMGIQLENIKLPVDNNGDPITNIVGYEILRGSREGNKSVLAKGMINNMREYFTTDKDPTQRFLYPNYPYNPCAVAENYDGAGSDIVVDHFLSGTPTEYDREDLNNWNAYLNTDTPLGSDFSKYPFKTNILNDVLTFHSPETNFRDPFLSAKELKVYGELQGTMRGKFEYPKDHPKHKFITNTSFLVSAIIGIGYAMLSTEGKKNVSHRPAKTDYGGTYAQGGVSIGTTGMLGISAPAAALQSSAVSVAALANKGINFFLSHSVPSMSMNVIGLDSNLIRDNALSIGGQIAGAAGGSGATDIYSREGTAWGATPLSFRILQGIPAFLTYWGEGVNKMLNIIYAFTPYRQYALQQISHCFYDKFMPAEAGQIRRAIDNQNYLNPELQDFAKDFRINNIYRPRTVALKLGAELDLPTKGGRDDTQALFSDVWPRTDGRWNTNAGFDEAINDEFERYAASHYVAMKQRLVNQYGQLAGIMQVPVSTDTHSIIDEDENSPTFGQQIAISSSPLLFNGDTYIGRYTEKNTMFFFYDWLKGQPDGTEFDYRLRKMITHPRFWMNTDPFDIGEFMASIGDVFSSGNAPNSFDVFMLESGANDPTLPPCDPNDPIQPCYDSNQPDAVCNCNVQTNCYFSPSEVEEICELQEEIVQLELYYDYLKDCACYVNDEDESHGGEDYDACNEDGTSVDDPASDPDYDDCNNTYTDGCGTCPDFGSFLYSNSKNASKYLNEDKGKWSRKIRRVERKIEKRNKKLNRKTNKLYDKYIDDVTGGDDSGFIEGIIEKLATPSDKYAFDTKLQGRFKMTVKQAFMYLFNSGVRDFYCESEINLDYRDWGDNTEQRHYDHLEYTNLRELFSTDRIKIGNYMKYDYSLSIGKLFNNYVSWSALQERSYDPLIAETCYVYRPKRLIYSLPQQNEDKKDNWRVFLPNNYKDFSSVTTAIKPIGKNGAMILFENESPVQFAGVDQLQTDGGTKITIGDGGLFSQPLQNLANAEYPHEYGSCQNRLSVANTPAGLYYMSQNQGKVFQVTGNGIQEISNQGMKWWFAKYLPYKLTDHPTAFADKEFELQDNPVIGVGCQTIFDNKNQIVFFCKKDWMIREDIAVDVVYLGGTTFTVGTGGLEVELGNPAYFRPASWTLSYDPKSQSWIGYHDWHPDLVLPSKNTYMTTKGGGLWVHADNCNSYCNFYGQNYPFEVEFSLHTQNQINTLRNVMYFMEVYKYADNCFDRFHELDFNFDEAVVYNSEQCSGLLKLILQPKNNAPEILNYPVINATDINILFSKEEQKYRFNQFWDITADRGEFNPNAQRTIFNTQPNGYIKDLNPNNLNYGKSALERKRFRHYKNTVLLRRLISGDKNMIISLAAQMNLNSPR